MNAGRDYLKARKQAQVNADRSGMPRWLHMYNGVWWISKEPTQDSERVNPNNLAPAQRIDAPGNEYY